MSLYTNEIYFKGKRVSFASSRLPVSIHFNSDDSVEESGFSIAVIAGYDPQNDFQNSDSCGTPRDFYEF